MTGYYRERVDKRLQKITGELGQNKKLETPNMVKQLGSQNKHLERE